MGALGRKPECARICREKEEKSQPQKQVGGNAGVLGLTGSWFLYKGI